VPHNWTFKEKENGDPETAVLLVYFGRKNDGAWLSLLIQPMSSFREIEGQLFGWHAE
jgi:hypothetical protein